MQLLAFPKRSIDELEDHILHLAQRMNAAEYEFLVAVREFDIRQGWKEYRFNSCAEWLNMKCGIVIATAREKVRTAHALFGLPHLSHAFEQGELSYSNVRALTRVATVTTEKDLVDYARAHTAAQVERHCRELRNADRALSNHDAQQMHANRHLTCHINVDGSVAIHGELSPEVGALFMKALQLAAEELEQSVDSVSAETFVAKQADALALMAGRFISGESGDSSNADHYQVVIHADEAALKSDVPVGKSPETNPAVIQAAVMTSGWMLITLSTG